MSDNCLLLGRTCAVSVIILFLGFNLAARSAKDFATKKSGILK